MTRYETYIFDLEEPDLARLPGSYKERTVVNQGTIITERRKMQAEDPERYKMMMEILYKDE